MRTACIAFLFSLTLWGCAGSPPKPAVSEYFETSGGGFIYAPDKDRFNLTLSLRPLIPLKEKLFAEAYFENPVNAGAPLVKAVAIDTGAGNTLILSPPVTSFQRFRNYKVEIKFFKDESRTLYLSSHMQMIQSRYTPEAMRKMAETER